MLTLVSLPTYIAGSSLGFFFAILASSNSFTAATNGMFVFTAVVLVLAMLAMRTLRFPRSANKGTAYALAPAYVKVVDFNAHQRNRIR